MDSLWKYFDETFNVLRSISAPIMEEYFKVMEKAYREERALYIFGNGGSASTASHFAQDLSKGTLCDFENQKRLRVISLCDNISGITAWSNDMAYSSIFEQQLRNLAREGDIAIGISGSGNSENVVNGLHYAKTMNMTTIAFTGYDGGKIGKLVDLNIHFPSYNMGLVEAAHSVVMHYLVQELKERFAKKISMKIQHRAQ